MDASLALPKLAVTPAYRSGAVVEFPVTRARAVTFRLVRADGTPVPSGATVTTRGSTAPVGYGGLVYLEDAAVAHASASWAGGRCEFEVYRPEGADPIPDLGTIACRDVAP
jgi:outer membrane usher protein